MKAPGLRPGMGTRAVYLAPSGASSPASLKKEASMNTLDAMATWLVDAGIISGRYFDLTATEIARMTDLAHDDGIAGFLRDNAA